LTREFVHIRVACESAQPVRSLRFENVDAHGAPISRYENSATLKGRQCANGYQRRQIDDAEHGPLLNRPLVVVTENRDSIKYKSAPEPPILAADSRGLPSLRIYPLAAFQSQFERDPVITSRRTAPSKICGQFVRSLSAAPVTIRRSRVDQVAAQIKAHRMSRFIGLHAWFNTWVIRESSGWFWGS
jgi:hypothetical protein